MKKIFPLLLTVTMILILPGCKKLVESLVPSIPNDSIPTITQPTQTDVGTPVGQLITKTIGKAGGSIASADGNAELIFPAGALDDNTDISIQAVTQTAPNGLGYGYQFLPQGIQFLQPVTLKFHYTADDLASTLGDLMGIAFQDSVGGWWRGNDFTNDTVNKIISIPIKHFTVYAHFSTILIVPSKKDLKVNQSVNLAVEIALSDDGDLEKLGPTHEDLAPLKKVSSAKIIWSATSGTVKATSDVSATFTAPAKVPQQNPVAVTAQIGTKFKYKGKVFDKTWLVSNIRIFNGEKYLLEISQSETIPFFEYKDSASLMVIVNGDGTVDFSDINNFNPEVNPGSITQDGCTLTWLQEGVGLINITNVVGSTFSIPGSANTQLLLTFTHNGAVTPKFRTDCSGDASEQGGVAFEGNPTQLSFTLNPDVGIYFLTDGNTFTRLTLQE